MLKVVSFDYFPLFDYWKVEFSDTEPWSQNFEWLGYKTTNFLQGIGSICILIILVLVYFLMMAIAAYTKCRKNNKCCKNIFRPPITVFQKSVSLL